MQESTKVVSNSMDEELSDHMTPGTLSRSSTASLGVLSNLNEVLAAAEDCSDYDDDPEFATRLAAIDESLSPLPSLGSIDTIANRTDECEVAAISQKPENSKDSTHCNWSEMEKTIIMKSGNLVETAESTTNIAAPEHEDISLNSIDISESYSTKTENASQYDESGIYRQESLIQKNCTISIADSSTPPPTNSAKLGNFVSSITKSRASAATTSRYSTSQASTYNRTSKGTSSVPFSNRTSILVAKAGSSKASSGTVSRTTTPTLSESEFGEFNSLSSITSGVSLSKAVASKLSAHSKVTNQRLTTRQILPTASKNTQIDVKNGRAQLPTKKTESISASLSKSMPRSTTYTRSLNTAAANRQQQQLLGASKFVGDVKSSRPVNSKTTVSTRVASSKGSTASTTTTSTAPFAKLTTSFLKKTTTKAIISSNALPHQPKRPSSVSSNCSSVASSHQITGTKKSLVSSPSSVRSPTLAVGAKRYLTTNLLSATAGGSSTKSSAASSRRSSTTSPSKPTGPGLTSSTSSPHTAHKQTATEQLRKYQALYWQQTEQIKRLRQELRQAGIQSAALLAINAHLINEYSPFKTPSLRAELAVLHDKSCTLHRNYELSKETVSQKEATILELETKLWEQAKKLDATQNEGESLKGKLADVEAHLVEGEEERRGLQEELQKLQEELTAEKEEHSNVLAKLNALEESCRSDKKYRDLKEKISTYQMEVDSLNVVIEMKTHRARNLESELMHCQSELANYENLKDSLVQLRRENEALTETVGMKARKNAEQSREIDSLRSDLKRELNERKRASIRNDQLEYQLNETRELLHDRSFADMSSIMEDAKAPNTSQPNTPFELNNSLANRFFNSASQAAKNGDVSSSSIHRNTGRNVRRLFSTPAAPTSGHGEFQSHRQHFQHQEPISAESKHRLPELVLSSISATNWTLTRPGTSSSSSSHCDNAQSDYLSSSKSSSNCNSANSSPLTSPKITKSKKNDSFNDFLPPNSSASMPTTTN